MKKINKYVEENSGKFDANILIGDLNTMQNEPLYRDLTKDWVDLFSQVGEGNRSTFPNSKKIKPIVALDYIFIKGQVNPHFYESIGAWQFGSFRSLW